MGVANITLTIEGNKTVLVPVEWQDIQIEASFDSASGRPSIDIDRFTFQNDAARALIEYRKAGLSGGVGVFEGLPANMVLTDQGFNVSVFNGYLDLSDDFEEIEPQFKGGFDSAVQVKCKFVDSSALNSFETVISGISFSYLADQGVFSAADYASLPFVIEKSFNPLEITNTVLGIYSLEQAIEDAIARVSSAIATISAMGISGITGPAAAAVLAIALVAIEIILALAMIALIIKLVLDLVNLLLSPVRYHKCTPLKTLVEKALDYFGYKVKTNLDNWANIHYLPSRPASDSANLADGIFPQPPVVKVGIPRAGDFGYLISEMLAIVRNIYGARIDIEGSDVLIYNESDPIWQKKAGYTMPDVLLPGKKYNTAELKQTRLYTARTDPADAWTIENYTGNAYEIKTEPKTVQNVKNVNIKGLQIVDFGVAWATRKDKLNNLESILKVFTDAASALMGVLKKGKKLKKILSRRVGMMKVSDSAHTVPKLVLLSGGSIPANHRDILGAKAIAEKYYKFASFVDDTDNAQRELYEGVANIPFTVADFQETLKSSNFITSWGAPARFNSLKWKIAADTAEADFEVQTKYTNNLKEVKLEEIG